MRDEDDADAAGLDALDNAEQVARLLVRERSRGLVHDDDLGLFHDRADDLDELLLGDGEARDLLFALDVVTEHRHGLVSHPIHLVPVDPPGLFRIAAKVDILRDRQIREELELLMDHGDAVLERGDRRGDMDSFAVSQDLAAVHRQSAGQDVHQRGFTGAILADECMNLALLQAEVHMIQRMGAGELFVDLLHFQQDLF